MYLSFLGCQREDLFFQLDFQAIFQKKKKKNEKSQNWIVGHVWVLVVGLWLRKDAVSYRWCPFYVSCMCSPWLNAGRGVAGS